MEGPLENTPMLSQELLSGLKLNPNKSFLQKQKIIRKVTRPPISDDDIRLFRLCQNFNKKLKVSQNRYVPQSMKENFQRTNIDISQKLIELNQPTKMIFKGLSSRKPDKFEFKRTKELDDLEVYIREKEDKKRTEKEKQRLKIKKEREERLAKEKRERDKADAYAKARAAEEARKKALAEAEAAKRRAEVE